MGPISSRATLHTEAALWGLLIPQSKALSHISDIVRGYVTQRLLWEVGGEAAFRGVAAERRRDVAAGRLQTQGRDQPPPRRHDEGSKLTFTELNQIWLKYVQDQRRAAVAALDNAETERAEEQLEETITSLLVFLSAWKSPEEQRKPSTPTRLSEESTGRSNEGSSSLPRIIESLWIDLYEHGFLELSDISLVQAWLRDLALHSSPYRFPAPLAHVATTATLPLSVGIWKSTNQQSSAAIDTAEKNGEHKLPLTDIYGQFVSGSVQYISHQHQRQHTHRALHAYEAFADLMARSTLDTKSSAEHLRGTGTPPHDGSSFRARLVAFYREKVPRFADDRTHINRLVESFSGGRRGGEKELFRRLRTQFGAYRDPPYDERDEVNNKGDGASDEDIGGGEPNSGGGSTNIDGFLLLPSNGVVQIARLGTLDRGALWIGRDRQVGQQGSQQQHGDESQRANVDKYASNTCMCLSSKKARATRGTIEHGYCTRHPAVCHKNALKRLRSAVSATLSTGGGERLAGDPHFVYPSLKQQWRSDHLFRHRGGKHNMCSTCVPLIMDHANRYVYSRTRTCVF